MPMHVWTNTHVYIHTHMPHGVNMGKEGQKLKWAELFQACHIGLQWEGQLPGKEKSIPQGYAYSYRPKEFT